ncbi:hypothetical protein FDP41_002414 [Naegleria fowleri]|uniref:Uncharacterized protein n=1 Tax=Naegleria fowleri TaxID=5763 RepID=A0A6A5BWC1_NAEFO|nr:uncharacterized protein FDP41_002414 [Naegleria fowleri]KAF0978594.1 hypothetical protein FDP41_002414 [Naegleria fowleri]CAG4715775.1 unnamed protein product [Naegleria fowleri]
MNIVYQTSSVASTSRPSFTHPSRSSTEGSDLPDDLGSSGDLEPPNPSNNVHHQSQASIGGSTNATSNNHPSREASQKSSNNHHHHQSKFHKNANHEKKKKRALNFLNNIPTTHIPTTTTNNNNVSQRTPPTPTASTPRSSSSGESTSKTTTTSTGSYPPTPTNNLLPTTTRASSAVSTDQNISEPTNPSLITITVEQPTDEHSSLGNHNNGSNKLTVNIPKSHPTVVANRIIGETSKITNNSSSNVTSAGSRANGHHLPQESGREHQKQHHHHRYHQQHLNHPKHHHHSNKSKTKEKALDFLSNIPMKKAEETPKPEVTSQSQNNVTLSPTKRPSTHQPKHTLPRHIKKINSLEEVFNASHIEDNDSNSDNQKEIEEPNDDEYIRRLHFMDKSAPVPFLVCSFIRSKKSLPSNTIQHVPSVGNAPLPSTNIGTSNSPLDHANLEPPTLSLEELINKQMELEAITYSKKPTSYRAYILEPAQSIYDPLFLDDPNIRTASKRKVMTFPGLMTSTIPFLKSKALKKDLNEQFRQQHENCLLTLSKIRNLKRKIVKVVLRERPEELAIAAVAFVYLEKMILKNLVHKANRKRIAAACLFLAFKLNLESPHEQRKQVTSEFLDEIENVFDVSRKKVVPTEFFVMAEGLHFKMIVDPKEIQPHLQRLMSNEEDQIIQQPDF